MTIKGIGKKGGTALKIQGIAGDPMRDIDLHSTIYIVAEVTIDDVEIQGRKPSLGDVRLHKGRIQRYAEMDTDVALDVLAGAAEQAARAADTEAGRIPMFSGGFGDKPVDLNEDDPIE
jgi:hypothetical protein